MKQFDTILDSIARHVQNESHNTTIVDFSVIGISALTGFVTILTSIIKSMYRMDFNMISEIIMHDNGTFSILTKKVGSQSSIIMTNDDNYNSNTGHTCTFRELQLVIQKVQFLLSRLINTCNVIRLHVLHDLFARLVIETVIVQSMVEMCMPCVKYNFHEYNKQSYIDNMQWMQLTPLVDKHGCLMMRIFTLKQCNWRQCRNKIEKLKKC